MIARLAAGLTVAVEGASTTRARRWLWLALATLALFRLGFAALLPITGDEGYFVLWGDHPAGGYYDHPPMVGWWLAALLPVSRAEWFLRLPAVVLPLILAWAAWRLARPHGPAAARWAALLVLWQPVNVWNVLITTDTPVILFSLLSVLAYLLALQSPVPARRLGGQALAGLLLGLAFLGKYFAALLGFAYLAHLLFVRRDAGRWTGFLLLLAAALPAPLYNLWWNSGQCWVNILFNFLNRNAAAGFDWQNPVLYLASLAYLATPWLLWTLWRARAGIAALAARLGEVRALCWLAGVPLGLFALMSLWRPVGLHWLVSFIPLLAVLAALALQTATLARLLAASMLFGVLHILAFVIALALPLQTWNGTRLAEGIALRVLAPQIVAQLEPGPALLAMESFSSAAFLAYASGRPTAVFGDGSFYARQDDFITDWRAQDGRDVLILRTRPGAREDYQPFFRRVEFSEIVVDGVRFYRIYGHGFDYARYHDMVLSRVRERFYRIPAWLPQRACLFNERYFPEAPR